MKYTLSIIVAHFLLGSIVHADFVKGSQTLALYGGFGSSSTSYDFKPGDKRAVTGSGGAFGAQYVYYVRSIPALGVGADVLDALNGHRHDGGLLTDYDTTAHLRSLVGLLTLRMAYPRGEVRPYIFMGAGAHHSTQELSARPQNGTTWSDGGTESRTLIDERKTSAALGYGIGLDLFPADSFFIGTELREVFLLGLDTNDNAALRAAGFTADETRGIKQAYVLMHIGWKF